jgi:hypothetical protein
MNSLISSVGHQLLGITLQNNGHHFNATTIQSSSSTSLPICRKFCNAA